MPGGQRRVGVRIAGTGSQLPSKRLNNSDLEKLMETNDEWIVQRTGIRERRIIDKTAGESTAALSTQALRKALDAARMQPGELDLIMCATMTPEMPCPATACLVSERIGAGKAGAMDLNAACSGFVFGLNLCHDLIKGGAYRNIALIGADTLSEHMHYCTAGRGTAIIFGDAAGAVILRATDEAGLGVLAQAMHADGKGWKDIYIPYEDRDFPAGMAPDEELKGYVQMNGAAVFKFAVGTFSNLIAETLEKASLKPEQVDMFVCHQSNARILHSARERFGLPPEKLYVNIDRVGNTVGASVPLCLDELVQQGRVKPGMKVMFVAFGGGLTWGSSLWQL
ncbi:MAG TPA: beta-ketoacyl-ACP synthase III [Phycisphaerales bacterium]|nr:beta-ketoacyl-ACP synthase III [Phycisphaerales bacterium]